MEGNLQHILLWEPPLLPAKKITTTPPSQLSLPPPPPLLLTTVVTTTLQMESQPSNHPHVSDQRPVQTVTSLQRQNSSAPNPSSTTTIFTTQRRFFSGARTRDLADQEPRIAPLAMIHLLAKEEDINIHLRSNTDPSLLSTSNRRRLSTTTTTTKTPPVFVTVIWDLPPLQPHPLLPPSIASAGQSFLPFFEFSARFVVGRLVVRSIGSDRSASRAVDPHV